MLSPNNEESHQKIRLAALDCLARREYSESMLQKKLLQRGFASHDILAVSRELIQEGLLSDLRFCEVFIAKRVRQGYGPIRIAGELSQQGIRKEIISDQLQQNKAIFLDAIKNIRQKKFSSLAHDPQVKRRQITYLQYRGFRLQQIKESQKTE